MKWIVMNYVVVAHCLSLVVSLCDVCGSCPLHYFRSLAGFALLKEISLNDILSCGFLFFSFVFLYLAPNVEKHLNCVIAASFSFFAGDKCSIINHGHTHLYVRLCPLNVSIIAYLNTSITWSAQMSVKTHYACHYEGITSLFIIPSSPEAAFFRCQWENVGDDSCLQKVTVWPTQCFSIHSIYALFITSLYNLLELCDVRLR